MAARPTASRRLAERTFPWGTALWRRTLSSCPLPTTTTAPPTSECCQPRRHSHFSATPQIQVGRTGGPFSSSAALCSPCTASRVRLATALTTRAMSSYEWKNMSQQAQKANKDFSNLTTEEVVKAGEEEIDKVEKALKAMEPFNDVFEVRREGLEVFVELGPTEGTYWIKFDLSIHQICLMSPRSGPHRYIFDKESGRWIGEADRHDFQGMLTGDIIQSACGIPDF